MKSGSGAVKIHLFVSFIVDFFLAKGEEQLHCYVIESNGQTFVALACFNGLTFWESSFCFV
jgi:hypothetical protein